MNDRLDEKLGRVLGNAVELAREVPVAAEQHAQVRLTTLLNARTRQVPRVARRWAVAGFAAAAAIALAITLPFMPGHGDAFAAALAHFREFRTLQMDVVQRHGATVTQATRTRVDAAGATRTDIGESLSVIVDPARGRVLTLLHDERRAAVADLDPLPANVSANLVWLEELRLFSGDALALPESRMIAGQPAHGWSLDLGGDRAELWARDDGWPLELRMHGDALQIDYRFTFDVDFPADLFDTAVPVGYSMGRADDR